MSKHAYHAAVYLSNNQLRRSGHITFTTNSPNYWNLRTSHSLTHLILNQQRPMSHTALKLRALHHTLGPENLLHKNFKQQKVSSRIWKALTLPRYTWSGMALNAQSTPDIHTRPQIQDCTHIFFGNHLLSNIDPSPNQAYHIIPIEARDIPKTAITTFFVLFEFTHIAFGLCSATQTFVELEIID